MSDIKIVPESQSMNFASFGLTVLSTWKERKGKKILELNI